MNWNYTTVPDGVDLDQPLMPLRGDDNGIYGVDPAWLNEVLTSWLSAATGASLGKGELPERPSAAWTNALYALMKSIKAQPDKPFYGHLPIAPFVSPPEGKTLGNIPDDVEVGAPVRREDLSKIFDWMYGVNYIGRQVVIQLPTLSWSSQYHADVEGARTEADIMYALGSASGYELYRWNWFYFNTDGAFAEQANGGGWRRDNAHDFSVVLNLPSNTPHRIFSSVHLFLEVRAEKADGTTKTIYVPAGKISPSGSEDDEVSVRVDAGSAVNAALSAFAWTEKPYKTNMETIVYPGNPPTTTTTGIGYLSVSATGLGFVFFEFADDYRHP